jgi:hypothetical protein
MFAETPCGNHGNLSKKETKIRNKKLNLLRT